MAEESLFAFEIYRRRPHSPNYAFSVVTRDGIRHRGEVWRRKTVREWVATLDGHTGRGPRRDIAVQAAIAEARNDPPPKGRAAPSGEPPSGDGPTSG